MLRPEPLNLKPLCNDSRVKAEVSPVVPIWEFPKIRGTLFWCP